MLSRVKEMFDRRRSGDNYPYVTARVRAMKTHLLPKSEFPKLLARDVHGIARSLEEGRYKDEIHDLASEYSGAQLVERATQAQLANEFQRILGWCEGEPKVLLGLYFERFTVANLKTMVRGTRTGANPEQILAALVPAGRIERQTWEAACRTSSLEECLGVLPDSEYTRIIEEMVDERLPVVENALDRAMYKNLVEAVEPDDRATEAFLQFLRREVDEVNLKIALRSKHAGVEEYEVVPGGRTIDEGTARSIQTADWEEVGSILQDTPFGEELEDALQVYVETRDLNELIDAIDRIHLEEAESFGRRYPLSILPIIDYVLRKKLEVDRLRMIAFGKQTGLPREEIEDLINV